MLHLLCVARVAFILLLAASFASALTHDELKLLQDPGGWEYMAVSDAGNGFPTQAGCFDPAAPGTCKGTLLFRPDMTFKKTIMVHGKAVDRGGTYRVDGNNIAFLDEFNNRDGPYTAEFNPDKKTLVLSTMQAGVNVRIDLLEAKEFHRQQEARKKHAPK